MKKYFCSGAVGILLTTFLSLSGATPAHSLANGQYVCGTSGTFEVQSNTIVGSSSTPACTGTVTIPEGVTAVDNSAFYLRSGVTSVSLPSTLITIGNSSFRGTSITSINIPINVTSIGILAFSIVQSVNVTSVTFADDSKLTTIGDYAFQYTDFTTITIPALVTSIGLDLFNLNLLLSSIYFLGPKPGGTTTNLSRTTGIAAYVTTSNQVGFGATWLGVTVGINPSVTFDASSYTSSATSWGIGSVPAMTKTSFGPQGVIFAGPTSGSRISATLGAVTEDTVSVEMWVKLDTTGSEINSAGSMLFSWGSTGGFTYNVYHFRGWLGFNTLNSELFGVDVSAQRGKWTHYTFIMKNPLSCTNFSASNCTGQKIYVNGQLQSLSKHPELSTTTHVDRGFDAGGAFLLMDNSLNNNTWNAIGTLGLARIYKGEVGATQTTNLYATTKSLYLPFFTLSSPSETRAQNTAANGFTISQKSEVINTFSVSPGAPSGMTFNTTTGALTGTPTVQAVATNYVVSATNTAGVYSQTFNLTVTAALAAPVFTISPTSEIKTANTAITGYTISSTGGAIASYSITPSIGNGLSFSTSTGLITGTPTSEASAVTYTVTATNVTGSSTSTFTLTVNPDPAIAEAAAENARLAAMAEAARVAEIFKQSAAQAAAAKQQREITEILSIIPSLGALAFTLNKMTKTLTLQKCVKKKEIRYVKKGAKCPKGFVRK
jgi:hypothetical protein